MGSYSNQHLTEVFCSFQFHPAKEASWDISFFGQYFDLIKEMGYVQKEERKGIQIQFSGNPLEILNQPNSLVQETETQMLYRDNDKGNAIILGNNAISFHKLKHYKIWNDFMNSSIVPGLKEYQKLGLPMSVKQCQYTYLNTFQFESTDNLKDYFTVFPETLAANGSELRTNIETNYRTASGILIVIRLYANPLKDGKRIVNLECGAVGALAEGTQKDPFSVAAEIHDPIREFFEKIITQKLRARL